MNLPIMHSDIPQAFIQSTLDSDSSWMTLPKGVYLEDTDGGACRCMVKPPSYNSK